VYHATLGWKVKKKKKKEMFPLVRGILHPTMRVEGVFLMSEAPLYGGGGDRSRASSRSYAYIYIYRERERERF